MRILQVIPYFPPANAFGGTVKVTYEICKELISKGHEVVVYTTDAIDLTNKLSTQNPIISDGIKVYYLRNMSMKLAKWLMLFVTPELFFKARDTINTYDIIHLNEYRTLQNAIIYYYAKKYKIPYILQAYGSLPRVMTKRSLKWIYDILFGYRLLKHASKVIATTRTEVHQCEDMGVSEDKIVLMPNGIDLKKYRVLPPKGTFRIKFNICKDEKIILYLGRISAIKGIDLLVEAYAYLLKELKYDKTLLVLAGPDDGYLGRVKQLLNSLEITKNVLICGLISEEDKLRAYVDADVVVLPSRFETLPCVILEAYACSKPVIASNIMSIPDIVLHRQTGLLFQSGNAQELEKAIAYMLTNPEEAMKMGSEACKLVKEKFSLEKEGYSLEALYQKVLEEKEKHR